jgi:uncharacterized membrane protein
MRCHSVGCGTASPQTRIVAGLARTVTATARQREAAAFILDIRAWFIQSEKVMKTKSLLMLAVVCAALAIAGASPDRAHELASQAASQTATQCASVATLADCHPGNPTGCTNAQNPRYDAYLNFLKNQQPPRDLAADRLLAESDFAQLEDSIPPGISTRNHADFANALASLGEGNIYAVVGYLYFVEDTAVTSHHRGETCNCQLKKAGTFDFHLGIGFDATLAQQIRQNPPSTTP